MAEWNEGPDDLVVPFIFVPKGSPEPTKWLAQHPGAIRIPATLVPRTSASGGEDQRLHVDLDTVLTQALQGPAPQGAEPLPKTRHRARVARTLPPTLSAKPSNPVADYLRVNAELDKLGLGHASAPRPKVRSQSASLPHSPADKAPSVGVAPPVPGPGKPPSEQATAAPHKPYPSPERLAAILYHETSGLREKPGGSSLADLRAAMANTVLNRVEHHTRGSVANDTLTNAETKAIATLPSAKAAYEGSLKAATEAIARNKAPTSGADSALFYNNRPNGSTDPNLGYHPPAPVVATFGPFHNVAPPKSAPLETTYIAFFGAGDAEK